MSGQLVSVIVPTYNRAYCIEKTLDSALAQTHTELEIVVIDDGSSDGTEELMARRYGGEPRVRYIRQANTGVTGARNHGLREARGDYVAFLDSDDLWLPWKLTAQLRCLAALPEAGMVWTDMDAMGTDGSVVARRYLTTMYKAYRWFPREQLFSRRQGLAEIDPGLAAELGNPAVYSGDIFSNMIMGNLVHTSTVLLRRERADKVAGFNEELRHSGEDYDYHLRTCREGPVAYLDAASILYQCGASDQIGFAPDRQIYVATNALKTIAPVIERERGRIRLPDAMIDEALAKAHRWVGQCYLDLGQPGSARPHLLASLRHRPRQPRVLGQLALSILPLAVAEALRRLYRQTRGLIGAGAAAGPPGAR